MGSDRMRTFQDEDLLTWEAYTSGGRHGFSADAQIAFHCLSDASIRPRSLPVGGDTADAARTIHDASPADLLALLGRAAPVP
jgi:hypothetical protein